MPGLPKPSLKLTCCGGDARHAPCWSTVPASASIEAALETRLPRAGSGRRNHSPNVRKGRRSRQGRRRQWKRDIGARAHDNERDEIGQHDFEKKIGAAHIAGADAAARAGGMMHAVAELADQAPAGAAGSDARHIARCRVRRPSRPGRRENATRQDAARRRRRARNIATASIEGSRIKNWLASTRGISVEIAHAARPGAS